MNVDCWLKILTKIPANERTQLRIVCRQWRDLIDHLAFTHKSLYLLSPIARLNSTEREALDSNAFHIPTINFSLEHLCLILNAYPNLRALKMNGFQQCNDQHLAQLTELCPYLEELSFHSCRHLGRKWSTNFSPTGWRSISTTYGSQLSTLILDNCDLEDSQFKLIVNSFPMLKHLDISNNSTIEDFTPLSALPNSLEILKLGPKLEETYTRRHIHFGEMPVDLLISANLPNLRELHLQGRLSVRLPMLKHLLKLSRLIIKYVSVNPIGNVCNKETDILVALICQMTQLRELNLYQVNHLPQAQCHWYRDRLGENKPIRVSRTVCHSNLEKFTLSSTEPLLVVDQFRLINFVLASCSRLSSFLINSSVFDSKLNCNLNQIILTLLQKYGHKLKELKLLNIFTNDSYWKLARIILTSSQLCEFVIEASEMEAFVRCLEAQLDHLFANGQLNPRDDPLKISFMASKPTQLEQCQRQICRLEGSQLAQHVHLEVGLVPTSLRVPQAESISERADLAILVTEAAHLLTQLAECLLTKYFPHSWPIRMLATYRNFSKTR